ncbi:MAG: phosphopantetheine-binding protein [Bacteroidales bacterium]
MEEIKTRIKDILVNEIEVNLEAAIQNANLKNNMQNSYEHISLFDDAGMDSLMLVDLISSLEIEFELDLQLQDFENLKTIEDLALMVTQKLSKNV